MTALAARPFQLAGGHDGLRWTASLLLVLLLHLALGYYIFFRQIRILPPPAAESVLIDLAPPPEGGNGVEGRAPPAVPPTPSPPPRLPLPATALPRIPAPSPPLDLPKAENQASVPDMQPPAIPSQPPVALPQPSVPLPQPPVLRPPVSRAKPEVAKPRPPSSKPQQPQRAQAARPPTYGQVAKIDPVQAWQLAVIERLHRFMWWPPNAPLYVTEAYPEILVTIDRKGNVLAAKLKTSSGYPVFDHSGTRIFKRAGTLPPPPPEMKGDPITFSMTVTFVQQPN